MPRSYAARCQRHAREMDRDGWPRLHSPVENGEYATLWRAELVWRLVWRRGNPPPNLMSVDCGAYAAHKRSEDVKIA